LKLQQLQLAQLVLLPHMLPVLQLERLLMLQQQHWEGGTPTAEQEAVIGHMTALVLLLHLCLSVVHTNSPRVLVQTNRLPQVTWAPCQVRLVVVVPTVPCQPVWQSCRLAVQSWSDSLTQSVPRPQPQALPT
jgi:hypothetical protein